MNKCFTAYLVYFELLSIMWIIIFHNADNSKLLSLQKYLCFWALESFRIFKIGEFTWDIMRIGGKINKYNP